MPIVIKPPKTGGPDTPSTDWSQHFVRVLLVEDDEDDYQLTADLLREMGGHRYVLDWVASYDEAVEAMARQEHDVCLVDYRLGEHDGLQLLRHAPPGGKPVIMLTGLDDPDVDLRAMEAGASDYLVKGHIDARTLERAIRYGLQRSRDEEALRQLHAQLEQRVQERTAALEESNCLLRKSEEAVKEASRRKDEFLMMLAHELRNPLAPLRNALQVLKLSGGDHQAIEKSRSMMERQVAHLGQIVDDLLDVSSLISGKVILRSERLDLARLVRLAAEDHRLDFEQAGLDFSVDSPEVPIWVSGDATRLTQVIDNLLSNARKFTERGGRVEVRVKVEPDVQQAVLTIHDTGVGIDSDMLSRLFDTFAQADRSLDRSKGGLGLGLSTVRGLVELHGGQVRAASAGRGRGSEFTVRLPAQPEPAALTEVLTEPSHDGHQQRILVVEDNRDSADSLRMLLELYGYEVNVAYTGPDGVKAAEEWHPSVVLCDIGLPGLDGYGVARQLREKPATAKTRMIAVTGYGSDDDRYRSREAGFDRHMVKPVDPEALHQALCALG
jgi:signal transduction histidine kinase